jgi:hypothetical protein
LFMSSFKMLIGCNGFDFEYIFIHVFCIGEWDLVVKNRFNV